MKDGSDGMKASENAENSDIELNLKNLQKFKVDLWKYRGEKGALIPLLQSAQDTYGYVPEIAINYISEIVGIPPSKIYGVITGD